MRKGGASGTVKLQSGGDAFSSASFHCARTTTSLDTGEPAPQAASAAVAALVSGNYYADPPSGQSPAEMERSVYSLIMSADGTYYAVNTNATTEMGVWTAASSAVPISIAFQSGSYKWTGTLSAGNKLGWKRGAQAGTLTKPN